MPKTIRKPKKSKLVVALPPVIVPPTDALQVYVTGDFPKHTLVTERHVRLIEDDDGVRAKVQIKRVKSDQTEHVNRSFPAGEAILTERRVGMAVHLAHRLFEDGAKNIRIYTLDGTYNVKFTHVEAKKTATAKLAIDGYVARVAKLDERELLRNAA